jgi:hypothetical protein
MLPCLVFHLIFIMIMVAVVFIGGFFATVSRWELHLIPVIVAAVFVCKYYFENCVVNIL